MQIPCVRIMPFIYLQDATNFYPMKYGRFLLKGLLQVIYVMVRGVQIINHYWMRLSGISRIVEAEVGVITPTEASIILDCTSRHVSFFITIITWLHPSTAKDLEFVWKRHREPWVEIHKTFRRAASAKALCQPCLEEVRKLCLWQTKQSLPVSAHWTFWDESKRNLCSIFHDPGIFS